MTDLGDCLWLEWRWADLVAAFRGVVPYDRTHWLHVHGYGDWWLIIGRDRAVPHRT